MRTSRSAWILLGGVALFFAAFLFYPIGYLLKGAFVVEGRFSLEFFELLLASPLLVESIVNSFFIAIGTTLIATVLALPLAHWMTRYDFAGKTLLGALLLAPMIMPPFVGALGMRQLLARFGSLNLFLVNLGFLPPDQPIDWLAGAGLLGMIVMQVLSLYPILYLNLAAAMANVDPALREAAQNLGAGGWRQFRTVTLPLIMPGYFAGAIIVFIWSFTDLGTPLIFGLSRVVPVQIFDAINDLNTNPTGYALVVFVLLLTVILFIISKRVLAGRRYEMMGRGHSGGIETRATRTQTLVLWTAIGGLLAVSLLPHLMVVILSLSESWFFQVLPQEWTLLHFQELLSLRASVISIRNSLLFASGSAVLDLIIGVLIAWLLTRQKIPFSEWLDIIAMLPLALPGLVLAFGYVAGFDFNITWLNPRHNPSLLLIISYSIRRLPYIVRSAYAGFQQASITLEEASANLGATPFRTLRKITIPLVGAHLVAGTILVFSFAMLEVSDSLILAMSEQYYPIAKMIWQLVGRVDPNAPHIASALGVVGMGILMLSLLFAGRILGRKMGQLFRVS